MKWIFETTTYKSCAIDYYDYLITDQFTRYGRLVMRSHCSPLFNNFLLNE